MEDIQVSNYSSSEIQPTPSDDAGGSDAQVDVGLYAYEIIFSAITLILGVPGNYLILRVYWSKTVKTSTHILTMSLALTDLLTCLFQVLDIASDALVVSGRPDIHLLDVFGLFETTCLITSIGVTVAIALDRYDCVCRPQRRFFTKTRGKMATVVSVLVALCIMTPQNIEVLSNYSTPTLDQLKMGFQLFLFLFSFMVIIISYTKVFMAIRKHVKIGLPANTAKLNIPRLDQPQQNTVAHKAPLKLEPALLTNSNKSGNMSLQKISVISVSTSLGASTSTSEANEAASEGSTENHVLPITGSEVPDKGPRDDRGRKERSTGPHSLQRKTTRMLFITSVVLMLTWTPYFVFICMSFAVMNGFSVNPVVFIVLSHAFYMLYINNFCNPIIYGLANRRFRKDCMAFLRNIHVC